MFNDPPKFVFLTGKRVLLVSTDPASNVGQVFGARIGNAITPIAAVAGLAAMEIDPDAAAVDYRARIVEPMRGVLPDKALKGIEEQLSGACTTEIAAFDEFTALLTDDAVTGAYDHIIFDTAPTGHTIRLLKLPGAWSGFLETGGDASCLGPLAGLDKQSALRRGGGQPLRRRAHAADPRGASARQVAGGGRAHQPRSASRTSIWRSTA